MSIDKNLLTRRMFLRGTGIALSLPWLETFATASSASKTPRRFVSIYHPDGVGVPLRRPSLEGLELVPSCWG